GNNTTWLRGQHGQLVFKHGGRTTAYRARLILREGNSNNLEDGSIGPTRPLALASLILLPETKPVLSKNRKRRSHGLAKRLFKFLQLFVLRLTVHFQKLI